MVPGKEKDKHGRIGIKMVSDRFIERMSLAIAVSGIIALYFIVQAAEPQGIEISKITGDFIGKTVSVNASIKEKPYWHPDGHLFLTLTDGKKQITTVFFSSQAGKIPELKGLMKGMNVTVKGKVSEYQNELEIIGSGLE